MSDWEQYGVYLQLIIVLLKEALYHAVETSKNDAHRLSEALPRRLQDLSDTVRPVADRKRNGQTYYEYVVDLERIMFLFGLITGHKENHVEGDHESFPKLKLKVVTIRELGHMISKGVSLPEVINV